MLEIKSNICITVTLRESSHKNCVFQKSFPCLDDFIIFQWDTVCDNAFKVSTSQTILVAGVLVGACSVSFLSDFLGRKRVLLWSVVGINVLGFCVAWVKHYWLFCLLRFFIGVTQQVSHGYLRFNYRSCHPTVITRSAINKITQIWRSDIHKWNHWIKLSLYFKCVAQEILSYMTGY